jgi:GNAT superfamily N-acetyltransferase
MAAAKLVVHPLTPARWPDLEAVFTAKGCSVAARCWCSYYRTAGGELPAARSAQAQANRAALRARVDAGPPPGLIAYRAGTPVGWVAIAPRDDTPKLQRSPLLKPVDDEPAWAITCFVVPSEFRSQGVASALLAAAVAYAKRRGARLVEGFPLDQPGRASADALWFGTRSMFDAAGFSEVARRKPTRPIMRIRPV